MSSARVYAKLTNDTGDDVDQLGERRQKLEDFKTYPKAERALTAIAKVAMAVLVGGSNIFTLVLLGTFLSMPVAVGILIGSAIYAAKAIRDVHKKSKQEKELTRKLRENLTALELLFDDELKKTLNSLGELSRLKHLSEEQVERVYAHLHELKHVHDTMFPNPARDNKYIDQLNDKIKLVGDRIRLVRRLDENAACTPDSRLGVISFPEINTERRRFSVVRFMKQASNRMLSFFGGAASAAGMGAGLVGLAMNVMFPTGWILGAILGASLLIGLMAVAIDYHLSRREEQKISKLERFNRDVTVLNRGVVIVKRTLGRVRANAYKSIDHELSEERYKIRNQDLVKRHEALLAQKEASDSQVVALRKQLVASEAEAKALRARTVVLAPGTTLFDGGTIVGQPAPPPVRRAVSVVNTAGGPNIVTPQADPKVRTKVSGRRRRKPRR